MNRTWRMASLAALALSACNAESPSADKTEAAAVVDHAAMGHDMADTKTPGDAAFTASETAKHTDMSAASRETLEQAYIAKMIAHHRGAVAMADVALAQSKDPEILRMAQGVKSAQTSGMAEMQAWRPAATAN